MRDLADSEKVRKGFFARMIDKLDKKMQEKARIKSCCGDDKSDKKSCCS